MMAPRDYLFSRPVRLLRVNGGGIACVLGGLQQRLDRGLGVIESDQGFLLLDVDLDVLDAFDLVQRLLDGDRAGRAGHASHRQGDRLRGGPGGHAQGGREGEYSAELFHAVFLSVKQRQNVGECKRDPRQYGHDPEQGLVRRLDLRHGADLLSRAGLRGSEDAPVGEEERHECGADKDRTIRFEHPQIADPRAAEANRHQHERAETAHRGEDRREAADTQGAATIVQFRHRVLFLRSGQPLHAPPIFRAPAVHEARHSRPLGHQPPARSNSMVPFHSMKPRPVSPTLAH